MKLHLPKGLRAALLACMVAMSPAYAETLTLSPANDLRFSNNGSGSSNKATILESNNTAAFTFADSTTSASSWYLDLRLDQIGGSGATYSGTSNNGSAAGLSVYINGTAKTASIGQGGTAKSTTIDVSAGGIYRLAFDAVNQMAYLINLRSPSTYTSISVAAGGLTTTDLTSGTSRVWTYQGGLHTTLFSAAKVGGSATTWTSDDFLTTVTTDSLPTTFKAPVFGGPEYTYSTEKSGFVDADGNTANPARGDGKGPVLVFDNVGTVTANAGTDTSDYGGVKVTGNSVVTCSLGGWGGAIHVGEGAVLNATYFVQLKNTEKPAFANVYVDGTLNFTGRSNIDVSDGEFYQNWHIGANGIINLGCSNFVLGNRRIYLSVVVDNSDEAEIAGLVNRTRANTTATRTIMTMAAGGNVYSTVSAGYVVYDQNGNLLTDATLSNGGTSVLVNYSRMGYVAMDLFADSDVAWTKDGTAADTLFNDANGTPTSYRDGDSVTINTGTVTVKTDVAAAGLTLNGGKLVLDGQTVSANSLTFGSAAAIDATSGSLNVGSLRAAGNASLSVTGTLTLANPLVIEDTFTLTSGTLTLTGNNGTTLVQGGTLNIDGGTLDLQVTTNNGTSAIANAAQTNVGAGGTLKLTGHDMLGWGANSPEAINLKGSEGAQAKLVISDRQGSNAAFMTMSSQLVLKGNALVQAADDVRDCGITVYGSKITASGTGNEISIDLKLREANTGDRPTWISDEDWATARSFATFDVAADGELSISGRLMDATGTWINKANVKKIGDGALIIKSDSSASYTGTWNIEGGTLRLESGAGIGNGDIAMAEGTALESGGTRELANTITGSGALSVLTGGSLTIKGNVTLGKTITNDGTLTMGDGGSLTFTSTSGLDERETVYSDPVETVGSGNGYKSGGFYVVKGGQNATSTTLSTVKLGDKDYVVTVEDDQSAYIVTSPPVGGDYFINAGTVNYGDAGNSAASNATEGLVLNGGNLHMLTSLNENAVGGGIKVQKNATISVAAGVAVDNIALTVNDGVKLTLDSTGDSLKLDAINGTGTVSSGKDLLVDKGGDFTGSYDGSVRIGTADAAAHQKLRTDANLTVIGTAGTVEVTGLNNAGAENNVLGGLDTTGASVKLDNKTDAGAPTKVTLGNASSMDGGVLEFTVSAKDVNSNLAADKADKPTITTNAALRLTDVTLKVNEVDNTGFAYNPDGPEKDILLFVVSDDSDSTANNVTVDMSNCSWMTKYFTNFRVEQGSINVVADANTGIYASHGQTPNGTAGLALAGKAMFRLNPQALTPDSELAQVLDMLDNHIASGNNGAMDKLGAALAGSSLSAVGMAVSDDVQRQLRAIRNRTTTMGVNECVVNEDMPYVNGWISGDGNYRQLSESGTDAGYQVSSWGGTVGVDVDVNPNLTLGVAVSALFGDYTGKAADTLTGDL
ncbi:MAG: beta strand repeat-containing protein, partial [Akkermansia sp.]